MTNDQKVAAIDAALGRVLEPIVSELAEARQDLSDLADIVGRLAKAVFELEDRLEP